MVIINNDYNDPDLIMMTMMTLMTVMILMKMQMQIMMKMKLKVSDDDGYLVMKVIQSSSDESYNRYNR